MTATDSPASIADTPLPPAIRTLWRIGALIGTAVQVAVAIVVGVLGDLPIVTFILLGLAAMFLVLRWTFIDLAYARWRWGIDDRWIERRSGVIVRTTQIVPRSRVQTLTTKTGPIDRWLDLSSIVIHTAGTHTPNLTIPHLEAAAADRLRSELGG